MKTTTGILEPEESPPGRPAITKNPPPLGRVADWVLIKDDFRAWVKRSSSKVLRKELARLHSLRSDLVRANPYLAGKEHEVYLQYGTRVERLCFELTWRIGELTAELYGRGEERLWESSPETAGSAQKGMGSCPPTAAEGASTADPKPAEELPTGGSAFPGEDEGGRAKPLRESKESKLVVAEPGAGQLSEKRGLAPRVMERQLGREGELTLPETVAAAPDSTVSSASADDKVAPATASGPELPPAGGSTPTPQVVANVRPELSAQQRCVRTRTNASNKA